jgi:hypothetical protein
VQEPRAQPRRVEDIIGKGSARNETGKDAVYAADGTLALVMASAGQMDSGASQTLVSRIVLVVVLVLDTVERSRRKY